MFFPPALACRSSHDCRSAVFRRVCHYVTLPDAPPDGNFRLRFRHASLSRGSSRSRLIFASQPPSPDCHAMPDSWESRSLKMLPLPFYDRRQPMLSFLFRLRRRDYFHADTSEFHFKPSSCLMAAAHASRA